ncbi:hypothetical protein UFOVP650_13 [uncultured Caudovirales phage]|uniref:Uncharacterized protein n=1 Tax=uncultured Caudovirales phage TaxID=2100421 RepID=A0A6J5NBL1_9CAUD|nr:hypothetical protein UFOVP650_13 [uncultured Caudovirales phage]
MARDGLIGVVRALGFRVEIGGIPPKEIQLWDTLDEPRIMIRVLLALVGNRTVLRLAMLELTAEVAQSTHERLAALVPTMRRLVANGGPGNGFPLEQVTELAAAVRLATREVLPFRPDDSHEVEKLEGSDGQGVRLLTNPKTVPGEHQWQWMASECVVSAFVACLDEDDFGPAFALTIAEAWASLAERLALFNQLSGTVANQESARMVCRKLRECVPFEALSALDTGLFGVQQVISA